jgi:hypothetical protein
MPGGLRNLLGVEGIIALSSLSADPKTFYGARIQPIFAANCIKCHGVEKHKGDLRLDNYSALMRGGKNGPVIRPGNAQSSDLFRRITLPASHDEFMPKGKQPLSADQAKVIELWIGAGASDALAIDAVKSAPSASAVYAEVQFEDVDPAAVAQQRSAIAAEVAKLQKQFPNILEYDSRSSAELRLNAATLGQKFGDQELEGFATIAEHITVADFSRTALTDHSAAGIAAMKRLRVLRLAGTRVTDMTVLRLDSLNQLESLDLFGTPITAAVLPTIAKLPKLLHCYVSQTGIVPGTSVPEGLIGKLVF